MINNKLIKCHNMPWDPKGDRPSEMILWVPEAWKYDTAYKNFCEKAYRTKTINSGFADYLLSQGATNAVVETWDGGS